MILWHRQRRSSLSWRFDCRAYSPESFWIAPQAPLDCGATEDLSGPDEVLPPYPLRAGGRVKVLRHPAKLKNATGPSDHAFMMKKAFLPRPRAAKKCCLRSFGQSRHIRPGISGFIARPAHGYLRFTRHHGARRAARGESGGYLVSFPQNLHPLHSHQLA